MHVIDTIIVMTYLILCILIGLYKSKSIQTLKEYTSGAGSLPNFVISTILFCSYTETADAIATMGQISTYGIFFIIPLFFAPIAWLFMAQVYGKNISKFRGCISISDIMEKLYGKIGKWVTNIVTLSLAVVVTTIQSTAIGTIAHYYFSIPVFWGTAIGALMVVFYSATGGMRAVALTDVCQFVIIMITIPIACSFVYHDVGEYSGIVNSSSRDVLKFNIDMNNIASFLSLILYNLVPETSCPFVQRFLMSKSSMQLTRCLRLVAAVHCPLIIFLSIIGLCVKIKVPYIQPDDVLLYFISNYIIIGVKGLVISGLLAAMLSTANFFLNNASILCARDIIGSLIRLKEKHILLIARVTTVAIGIIVILLSVVGKRVMELVYLAVNFESIISISLTAGFLGFKTNSRSFMAATVFATFFIVISGYMVGDLGNISFLCGMLGSALGLFGMHYWQVHQVTLNLNTQTTKFTNTNSNTNINLDANIDDNIELVGPKSSINITNMYEDREEKTKTIADELRKQSFIRGVEKGRLVEREKVAKNLLLQGLDIGIIESATGLSSKDLAKLQQNIKTTH